MVKAVSEGVNRIQNDFYANLKKKQDTAVLGAMLDEIAGRVQAMAPDRSAEPEAAPVLWQPSLYPYRGIFPGLPGSGFGN